MVDRKHEPNCPWSPIYNECTCRLIHLRMPGLKEKIDEQRHLSANAKGKAEDPHNTPWERGYFLHDFRHYEEETRKLLVQYHKERDQVCADALALYEKE